ncbi:MAG TPA: ion channel [Flavobacteriales bacterium]|jgi:inward rectifier potassium channel|nr:ion channel [Flavobacteriales bacterium]
MALKHRRHADQVEDPGIGTSFEHPLKRLMGKDGQFIIRREGELSGLREGFIALVTMSVPRLIGTFIAGYLGMNLFFGSLYMAIGVHHIGNADMSTLATQWMSAIGMSVQTLTTVGYGSLYPNAPAAWVLAAVEGVFGILGFSLISAVIYARFARPTTRLAYSEKALIAPFKDGWAFMLRLANRRSTLMVEIEARLLLVMAHVDDEGERLNYYNLKLQLEKVNFMPLSWTLVHPITPESPLAGLSHADLVQRRAEVILILKGIDEGYMQQVITRHSYRYDEIAWGGRYVRAFNVKDGHMRLDLEKLSEYTEVGVPERLPE